MAGRELSQREHQRDWYSRNPNHSGEALKKFPSAWDKECQGLLARGIQQEELVKYERKINSPVANVNEWNDDIIKMVNTIADNRRQQFLFQADGVKGKDLAKTKRRIEVLKDQIAELQRMIREAGGVYERSPDLFDTPVVV